MHVPKQLFEQITTQLKNPATPRELARLLRIPRENRATFKRQLEALVADGHLVHARGHRLGLPESRALVAGRVHANAGGFAFVVRDAVTAAGQQDIYVAPANLNGALHGDRVLVETGPDSKIRGPEGRIARIVQRANDTIVGRFELVSSGGGRIVAFDRRITADIQVPSGEASSAEHEDMVVAEITRWPTASRGAAARVIQVLGNVN